MSAPPVEGVKQAKSKETNMKKTNCTAENQNLVGLVRKGRVVGMVDATLLDDISQPVSIGITTHPQSKKQVRAITILGKTFVYSDKRGFGNFSYIDSAFAEKIMHCIPASVYNECYRDHVQGKATMLKWHHIGDNQYQLMIHGYGMHVWTSKPIIAKK